jgi:hypothetical protein
MIWVVGEMRGLAAATDDDTARLYYGGGSIRGMNGTRPPAGRRGFLVS